VSTDRSDVDFVIADEPGGADEDLPETADSPWWLRARVPLGVAAAVVLLAGLLFRVTSGGSDAPSPAAAPGSGSPTVTGVTGPTATLPPPLGHGPYIIRLGPIGRGPGCHVLPQCITSDTAPDSIVAALHDFLPHARITYSRTSLERTGIAGRHHRFRFTTVVARRGVATVRITVSRSAKHPDGPAGAGERETAFGSIVYAHAHVGGYAVSIDVTAPTGHAPVRIHDVVALAGDARLRPAA
jgi:hypothetical protein